MSMLKMRYLLKNHLEDAESGQVDVDGLDVKTSSA